MSMDCTASANHADAASTAVTGNPVAAGGFVKSTIAQGRRFFSFSGSSDKDTLSCAMDVTSATSGKLVNYLSESLPSVLNQQTPSIALVPNTWMHIICRWLTTNSRDIWVNGANKVTNAGIITPTALANWILSGRVGDHTFNAGGPMAQWWVAQKGLDDVETMYLGLGGNPQATNVTNWWKLNRVVGGVIPDEIGNVPLTVTGTFILGADDPDMATYYTGSPIGDQSWHQGTGIVSINVSGQFDNANSPFTLALYQIGATSTGSTTAAAPGTATRIVSVTSAVAAGIAVGDYVSVGGGAKTRVNAVLVGTAPAAKLLVSVPQTFVSGAAVTRFAAAPASVPGIAANNTITGTPTGTQTSTAGYFMRSINTKQPTNQTLQYDSPPFAITVAATPVAPVFSVAPKVVTAQADGFTTGFTPNTACVAYQMALPAGTAQPTGPTIKAQASGLANSTKAVSGADTLTLTGIDYPIVDIWTILSNAQGDSAVTGLLTQQKLPVSGKVYRIFTSIDAATRYNGNCVVGDIEETDSKVSPAQALLTYSTDGNESYLADGRQLRVTRTYNKAGKVWYVDDAGVIYSNVWYNALPPVFTGVGSLFIADVGVSLNINLRNLMSSLDTLTFTAVDMLPAGLQIVNGSLTGIATGNSNGNYAFSATDSVGLLTVGTFGLIVGSFKAPNLFLLEYHDAIAVLTDDHLKNTIVFTNDEGPPNIVLSQNPPFNADVKPNDTVTLQVSRTPAGEAPDYGLRNHSYQVEPKANGDLDTSDPTGV